VINTARISGYEGGKAVSPPLRPALAPEDNRDTKYLLGLSK